MDEKKQNKKSHSSVFARLVVYFVLAAIIFSINLWINNSNKNINEPPIISSPKSLEENLDKALGKPSEQPSGASFLKKQKLISQQNKEEHVKNLRDVAPEGIIKKVRVQRGGDYIEGFFYRKDEQIAREKNSAQGALELYGDIPDCKVTLVDENNKIYGEEYYRWGKKHGPAKTYLSDGTILTESYYELGELKTQKEYYRDGKLRLEVDYRDARKGDREVGIGKLYYRNGALKYEWHLTNRDPVGFKKSYNTDGTLRSATYYDAKGREKEK